MKTKFLLKAIGHEALTSVRFLVSYNLLSVTFLSQTSENHTNENIY